MSNQKYNCQKDFLIILPAGDESLHENWYNSEIYDLFIIYYGQTRKRYMFYLL